MLRFLYGRQLIEDFLTVDAIASECIDGEIAYTERGEILEEMGALRWVDLETVYAGFYNDMRSTDMAPPDGDAQPRVAASPSAGADEEVTASLRFFCWCVSGV